MKTKNKIKKKSSFSWIRKMFRFRLGLFAPFTAFPLEGETFERDDAKALRSDWQAVGNDMRSVMGPPNRKSGKQKN